MLRVRLICENILHADNLSVSGVYRVFILNENEKLSAKIEAHTSGGLYKNVKMSVKTADKIILLGIIVLVVLIVAAVCGAEPSKPQNTTNGSPTEVWEVTQAETK